MATQPTNLPVPSESPRDLKFNAGKIDEEVTSTTQTYYLDRFGNKHQTNYGREVAFGESLGVFEQNGENAITNFVNESQAAIAAYGYITVDSFQAGATITLHNQILRDTSTGEYYRWDGSIPAGGVVVPPGSTPDSAGGIGIGKWISVGDGALRTNLASFDGSKLVGICENIAELKSVTANAGERIQVKGYQPFTTVGGGDFVYIESIPAGWHDEGIYIASTAMSGYWQRLGPPTGMDLFNWGLLNNPEITITDLGEVLNRAMIHNRAPVIPAGTWVMSSIANIPSNTVLSGRGIGNTVVLREGSMNSMFMNKSDGTIGGYGATVNITIQDFTIDARMDDYPAPCTPIGTGHASSIRISRVEINNVPGRWHAIELNATYDAVIEDCRFARGGLDMYDGECIQLDAAIDGGPFPWFGPYDLTVCGKIIINRCTFSDWSSAIGSHSGITGSRWIDLRITDCDMFVSKAGIKIIGWSGVIISRNRILYVKANGYPDTGVFYPITLKPSLEVINADVVISDNQIVWEMDGVFGSDHRGIQIKGNGTDATGSYRNVIVSNNTVRGSFRAHISADDIIDIKIDNNKIQKLGGYATGASNFAGIALYGTRNGTVTNNTIESGFNLIASKGTQATNMERIIVNGNDVSGSIGIDNEFLNQVVTSNICSSIGGGTKTLAARNVGKYRSQTVVCLANVEVGVAAEAQITTS
ncbi:MULTISPECIES: glycosyl hydrolase family 28-related protein [Enterobacteriaceae]|uniref:Tail spike TSP1/Gp66 N-terminal domain-containing protein n=1 Tax=Shigella sonnei TaxID=624 RepID=A0AAE5N500_SHISO|nr:glycosyl hydrolase family 28-related protein [Shigella sonnei]OYG92337.1 hypothetical protein CI727_15655 [Shigella sonnei]OYI13078.1 hypothetical protein CI726_01120 [Shigella sonnei]